MPIEVDVQLCCNSQQEHILKEISWGLSGNYVVIKRKTRIYLSFEDCTSRVWTLNEAIASFLGGLTAFKEQIVQLDATLRVGLFYQLSETIVCPVMLSRSSLKMLDQFNLDLDVSGYPCSDDD